MLQRQRVETEIRMTELLNVKGLCRKNILNEVDFQMERGEMIAIMGPSGSGKSTLLYQLAGMDTPDSGAIIFQGHNIAGLSEDERARLRLEQIGFVFQQMNMIANLKLLDNILLPAVQLQKKNKKNTSRSGEQLKQEAEELMRKLGIDGLENRRITEVSGGQLQRACICRALMNHPAIIYADEPTGALNRKASGEVMEEFIKLNREGTSILMVTHDSKVAGMCDKVLYLVDGRIEGSLELGKYRPQDASLRDERMKKWLDSKEA